MIHKREHRDIFQWMQVKYIAMMSGDLPDRYLVFTQGQLKAEVTSSLQHVFFVSIYHLHKCVLQHEKMPEAKLTCADGSVGH